MTKRFSFFPKLGRSQHGLGLSDNAFARREFHAPIENYSLIK
jgi:hypothetical protein